MKEFSVESHRVVSKYQNREKWAPGVVAYLYAGNANSVTRLFGGDG